MHVVWFVCLALVVKIQKRERGVVPFPVTLFDEAPRLCLCVFADFSAQFRNRFSGASEPRYHCPRNTPPDLSYTPHTPSPLELLDVSLTPVEPVGAHPLTFSNISMMFRLQLLFSNLFRMFRLKLHFVPPPSPSTTTRVHATKHTTAHSHPHPKRHRTFPETRRDKTRRQPRLRVIRAFCFR